MANINLHELSNSELQDLKFFVEAEMKARTDRELTEQAHKLANIIQQIVDLGYTVRESTRGDSEYPQYTIEDEKCIDNIFRIIPDYAWHNEDEMEQYGYTLQKWDGSKKDWKDITNV